MERTTTHLCPGGCGRAVSNELLACSFHWKQVPQSLQHQVYRTYRQRQARPTDPTAIEAHQQAMDEAIAAMRK
jgi:hypothetical protein